MTFWLSVLACFASTRALVCVAVSGLSRSANYTHESFDQYVLRPMRAQNIDYFVYFHTWLPRAATYNNYWSGEIGIQLSGTDHLYMPANKLQIEAEMPLNVTPYATHGDPWQEKVEQRGGVESQQLEHIIYALLSQYRVTLMWKQNRGCKTVIYTRPDSLFLHELDVRWLESSDVLTPNFARWPINDRLAIGPADKMQIYGERFLLAEEYAQRHPLHTEQFLAHIFKLNLWPTGTCIDFCFFRTRANGLVVPEPGVACEPHVRKLRDVLPWVPVRVRPPKYKKL